MGDMINTNFTYSHISLSVSDPITVVESRFSSHHPLSLYCQGLCPLFSQTQASGVSISSFKCAIGQNCHFFYCVSLKQSCQRRETQRNEGSGAVGGSVSLSAFPFESKEQPLQKGPQSLYPTDGDETTDIPSSSCRPSAPSP